MNNKYKTKKRNNKYKTKKRNKGKSKKKKQKGGSGGQPERGEAPAAREDRRGEGDHGVAPSTPELEATHAEADDIASRMDNYLSMLDQSPTDYDEGGSTGMRATSSAPKRSAAGAGDSSSGELRLEPETPSVPEVLSPVSKDKPDAMDQKLRSMGAAGGRSPGVAKLLDQSQAQRAALESALGRNTSSPNVIDDLRAALREYETYKEELEREISSARAENAELKKELANKGGSISPEEAQQLRDLLEESTQTTTRVSEKVSALQRKNAELKGVLASKGDHTSPEAAQQLQVELDKSAQLADQVSALQQENAYLRGGLSSSEPGDELASLIRENNTLKDKIRRIRETFHR